MKKTALSSALVLAMGLGATAAQADIVQFNWTGVFTMINPVGDPLSNGDSTFKGGYQTKVSGSMVFNNGTAAQTTSWGTIGSLGAGAGSATVNSFNFFGGGPASAHDITMQAIGDGSGSGTGFLVAGNMLFDWNGNNNINVDIVLNAGGFFTSTVDTNTGIVTQGAGAVANDFEPLTVCVLGSGSGTSFVCLASTSLNHGPALMATVDGNPFVNESVTIMNGTTTIVQNWNRHTDGLSGIMMDNGPFPGFNANFDVWAMTMTNYEPAPSAVPVPAAAWLFGSGLLGLVGVSRRRKS